MSPKTKTILSVLAVVIVIVAWQFGSGNSTVSGSRGRFIVPGLGS